MLLALGVALADALGSSMGRAGGYSDGRDIGVVFNYPNPGGARALPMCGGVGAQYTPTAGWAQAVRIPARGAGRPGWDEAIGVVLGRRGHLRHQWLLVGADHRDDAEAADAVLHRGQWLRHFGAVDLPDARRDIAANLASFKGLTILNGDGTEPVEAARADRAKRWRMCAAGRGRACCA